MVGRFLVILVVIAASYFLLVRPGMVDSCKEVASEWFDGQQRSYTKFGLDVPVGVEDKLASDYGKMLDICNRLVPPSDPVINLLRGE